MLLHPPLSSSMHGSSNSLPSPLVLGNNFLVFALRWSRLFSSHSPIPVFHTISNTHNSAINPEREKMDGIGTASNVIQLVSQAVKLYQHIADSRYFEHVAGKPITEIAFLLRMNSLRSRNIQRHDSFRVFPV
jgi:hypothetical protein